VERKNSKNVPPSRNVDKDVYEGETVIVHKPSMAEIDDAIIGFEYVKDLLDFLSIFVYLSPLPFFGWFLSTVHAATPNVWDIFSSSLILVGSIALSVFTYRRKEKFELVEVSLDDLAELMFVSRFGLVIPSGATPQERIADLLVQAQEIERERLKDLASINKEIIGRSGKTYVFDVQIRERGNIVGRLTSGRLGREAWQILAKRFDKALPVDKEDLSILRQELLDIYSARALRLVPMEVFVFSTSSFTNDAIRFLENGENWIPPVKLRKLENPTLEDSVESSDPEVKYVGFTLVHEKAQGYETVLRY